VAKWESYNLNVALAVCKSQPTLIGVSPEATEEEIHKKVSNYFDNKAVRDIASHFEKRLQLPFTECCTKAGTTIAAFEKAKAIRNIHVHNRGSINARNSAAIDATLPLNTYYPISVPYLITTRDAVSRFAAYLDSEVVQRYPLASVSES